MKNKFFTARGWLTMYAMACGYMHQTKGENEFIVLLSANNIECNLFEIKVYGPHSERYEWEIIEGLPQARAYYTRAVKKYIGTKPTRRFEKAQDVQREVYA